MGVMDRFLGYMKLNDEEDDGYDYDDYYDEEEQPAEKKSKIKSIQKADSYDDEPRPVKKSAAKVTPMHAAARTRSGSGMEVCVIKPTTVEDAREITETLLANRTVVLNMEGIHTEVAQRIIDFTSGATYSMNGNLQKISNYIFIATPESVELSGDFQDLLNNGTLDMGGMNLRL